MVRAKREEEDREINTQLRLWDTNEPTVRGTQSLQHALMAVMDYFRRRLTHGEVTATGLTASRLDVKASAESGCQQGGYSRGGGGTYNFGSHQKQPEFYLDIN